MNNAIDTQPNISSSCLTDANANCYEKETVDSLSNGLLKLYTPSLTHVRNQLKELTDKQSVLVDQLHNENLKLTWALNSAELQEMYDTMKLYHNKLVSIKRDMRSLHERSLKLKKRTAKLQQHVEKDVYIKQQQKEMELKVEQTLIKKTGQGES